MLTIENSISVYEIIAIILNLAGFLILFLTLREMNNQRKTTYLPNLYIKKTDFKINIQREKNNFNNASVNNMSSNIFGSDALSVELFNSGLGSALNIKTTWLFNVEHFSYMLSNISDEFEISEIYEKETKRRLIQILTKSIYASYILKEKYEIDYFDICPPFSKDKTNNLIFLSGAYETFFTKYIHSLLNKKVGPFLRLKSLFGNIIITNNDLIPPLFLKIDYEDIGQNKYTKFFEFKFNKKYFPMYLSNESTKTNLILTGTLFIKEIKNHQRIKNYLSKSFGSQSTL